MAIPTIASIASRPSLLSDAMKPDTLRGEDSGFASLLSSAIANVEQVHNSAHNASEELLINGKGDIHEVALMSQRAELSMELFQQVRNKLVQTYQEVMRMPM